MWSKGGEEAGKGGGESKMLQVWEKRTQEVGVSKGKRKKKGRGSGTTVRSVGESEGTLWSKRTTSRGSSNEYGGMDDTERSNDLCRV